MGWSGACAVGPGMMLAVGKLSHGNGGKPEVNKGAFGDTCWPRRRPASGEVWDRSVRGKIIVFKVEIKLL